MLTLVFCGDLSQNFKTVSITGNNTLLPVELLEFEVFPNPPNGVRLDWTTTVEENNKHFLVERSADGRKFVTIGQVKGAGDSFVEQKYRFSDNRPLPGLNYYRLAQVDYDGTIHRHEVISVLYEQKANIKLFPNPVADGPIYLDYFVTSSGTATLEWMSAAGQVLSRELMELERGSQRIQLELGDWPSGLYHLRMTISGEQLYFQLSKQ